MPLINLTSDLTALRYGGDRPGGGWSGQPYVQSPNPSQPSTLSTEAVDLFNQFYRANKTTSDFPIRGGAMGILETPAGRIDRSRIQAFLNDPAKGTIFKLKQQGLQLSNPNIQVPTVVGTSDELPILENTRFYSPNAGNTLLQTQLQGTGIHIPRHGLSPLLTIPYQSTYEYFVSKNNTAQSNRLTLLATLKLNQELITRNTGRYTTEQATNPVILGFANRYGISPLNDQILNYGGGPGSVYGIGFTRIRRQTDTTQAQEKAQTLYNVATMTYAQLSKQTTTDGQAKWKPRVQDFRGGLSGTATADYEGRSQWYNPSLAGDPGRVPAVNRIDYRRSTVLGVDKVNSQNPFYYNVSQKAFWEVDGVDTKDIIKFGFECLSNDDATKAIALVFRAYLTNLTDNHQAEYNSFKYLGRGETFRTYQGFDRSIGFSFKIAAQSRDELQPLYKKLNHLISQVYPDYSKQTGLMRGSVVRLTIGDYIYRVPGFLESVNVSVDDGFSWEINLENSQDVNQVPQAVNVQCSFRPIHDFLPRRETYIDQFVPLIGNTTSDGKSGWLATEVENPLQTTTPGIDPRVQRTLTNVAPPITLPNTLPEQRLPTLGQLRTQAVVGNLVGETQLGPSAVINRTARPGRREFDPNRPNP